MSRTGQPAVRHIASVERGLAVLDVLAAGRELGTNEVARLTGINASTVSRLLATLAHAGYVEHVAESGRYRLGLRLLELGNAVLARLDLREIAHPHLQALAEETGETVTLSAPGEGHAVTVDFVQSASVVQSVARLGRPSIGHATAAGKIVLAFSEGDPPAKLEAYTDRTITDRRTLAAELERDPLPGLRRGGRRARAGVERHRRSGLGSTCRARRDPGSPGSRATVRATCDAQRPSGARGARRGDHGWPRRHAT